MTHGYTKSILPTPRKGLFTLITKPQILQLPQLLIPVKMISKGYRDPSGLEQVWMKYMNKNFCCIMISVRIHLLQDDTRPKDGGQVSLNTCGLWNPLLLFSPEISC